MATCSPIISTNPRPSEAQKRVVNGSKLLRSRACNQQTLCLCVVYPKKHVFLAFKTTTSGFFRWWNIKNNKITQKTSPVLQWQLHLTLAIFWLFVQKNAVWKYDGFCWVFFLKWRRDKGRRTTSVNNLGMPWEPSPSHQLINWGPGQLPNWTSLRENLFCKEDPPLKLTPPPRIHPLGIRKFPTTGQLGGRS